MNVQVEYVDGSTQIAPLELWPDLRGDGVDSVTISTPHGSRRAASHSLYWLYPEDSTWVTGEASVGYDPNPLTEVVFNEEWMAERKVDYLPDLKLEQIKLGWWVPGRPRP